MVTLGLATIPLCGYGQPADNERPNLLVVMADQFRGDALGFLEREGVFTPNLDRFSKSAVVLDEAISSYPVSSPARAMFLTGMYPHNNGVITNCESNSALRNVELKQEAVCWSDVLKAEGYATAYIGKWHLDKPLKPYVDCANNKGKIAWNEWCPPARRHGFDYWVAYGTYDFHLRPLYWNTEASREEFYYVDQWGPEYEADLAIRFIDSVSTSKQPFAMMVSMNPPHTPYHLVPERYKRLYADINRDSLAANTPELKGLIKAKIEEHKKDIANYYACISGVDDQFGRIVAALESRGLRENTVVVFVSDHGDLVSLHEGRLPNIEYRNKNIFYEESMRIPFMISYPAKLKPRVDSELLISIEDFYPSVLSLMGLRERIPASVQSRDLSAQIMGSAEKGPSFQLYMRYMNIRGGNPRTGMRGVRTARYTYAVATVDGVPTEEFLYDRETDPHQLHNIAYSRKAKQTVKELRGIMEQRLREIGDPCAGIAF